MHNVRIYSFIYHILGGGGVSLIQGQSPDAQKIMLEEMGQAHFNE